MKPFFILNNLDISIFLTIHPGVIQTIRGVTLSSYLIFKFEREKMKTRSLLNSGLEIEGSKLGLYYVRMPHTNNSMETVLLGNP